MSEPTIILNDSQNLEESSSDEIATFAEAIVHRQNDLWNNKNFKVVDDFFDQNIICFNPHINTIGIPEIKTKFLLPIFNSFPDLQWVAHEVISDGSVSLVTRWSLQGTFSGSAYMGYEANGHKISWEGITVFHFNSHGKIYEMRSIFDTLEFFAKLAIKK